MIIDKGITFVLHLSLPPKVKHKYSSLSHFPMPVPSCWYNWWCISGLGSLQPKVVRNGYAGSTLRPGTFHLTQRTDRGFRPGRSDLYGCASDHQHPLLLSLFPRFHHVGLWRVRIFGGVMIGVELKVGVLLDSFEFLKTFLGKGLFYI